MDEIAVFRRDEVPEAWQVEELDSDGDGGIDVAIFSGPNAKVRADEHADRLRAGGPAAGR